MGHRKDSFYHLECIRWRSVKQEWRLLSCLGVSIDCDRAHVSLWRLLPGALQLASIHAATRHTLQQEVENQPRGANLCCKIRHPGEGGGY